jgi:hypothetical protein
MKSCGHGSSPEDFDHTPLSVIRQTKLESDFTMLDADAASHPAYSAFLTAMEGRLYGREPLRSAWQWFKTGWDSGED